MILTRFLLVNILLNLAVMILEQVKKYALSNKNIGSGRDKRDSTVVLVPFLFYIKMKLYKFHFFYVCLL